MGKRVETNNEFHPIMIGIKFAIISVLITCIVSRSLKMSVDEANVALGECFEQAMKLEASAQDAAITECQNQYYKNLGTYHPGSVDSGDTSQEEDSQKDEMEDEQEE